MNFTKSTLLLSLCALPLFAQSTYANDNQLASPAVQPNVFGSAANATTKPVAVDAVAAKVGAIKISASSSTVVADGNSMVTVNVVALDVRGNLLAGKSRVTIELKNGTLVGVSDLDTSTPATQIDIVDGKASFRVKAPIVQQDVLVRVTVGFAEETLTIKAMPNLRDMVAAGVIEIRGHLNRLPPGGIVPAGENDLFERELIKASETFNNEKGYVGARAAFYLKGKVKGEYLLSAMYDSEKDTRGQKFRDIDPEKFYAVYGDSSLKGVEAQSSGKFFVRLDKDRSYVLYGDYATQDASINQFGNYSRGVTGVKWHIETDTVKANAFASYESLKQVVDEFAARGVSGPYSVSNPSGVAGSERVEIIVRDRNQPSIIRRTTLMTRYEDYDFEPFNGRILFKSPVASFDADLNPVYIRVTYEVENNSNKFLVAGANAQVKVNENLTLAATAAKDNNPLGEYSVGSIAAEIRAGKFLAGVEVAKSQGVQGGTATGNQEGNASRMNASYSGDTATVSASVSKADVGFSNQSGGVGTGRQEANIRASAKVAERVNIVAEALKSDDLVTHGSRQAASIGAEIQATDKLKISIAAKQAKDIAATSPSTPSTCAGYNGYQNGFGVTDPNTGSVTCTGGSAFPIQAGGLAGSLPGNDVTSINIKASYQVTQAASVFAEVDNSTNAGAARLITVGGDVAVAERLRLYTRLEDSNASAGTYGLTANQHTRQGLLGVSSDYMTDGQVFNEYRMSNTGDGSRTENALGLRNGFKIAEGLKLNTNIEFLKEIKSSTAPLAFAKSLGAGLEYTGSKDWKSSARLELRQDSISNNVLTTVSVARKLSEDWTLLGRNYSNVQLSRTSNEFRRQDQFQVGFAYRPQTSNAFNLLAKYEYRVDDNKYISAMSKENAHVASLHTSWHPTRLWDFSNRFAYKQRLDNFAGLADTWSAWLVGGRVTYDLTERVSLGAMYSVLTSKGARQYGSALEVGYIVMPNLMLNLGYNIRGLSDKDLVASDYRNRGWYFGMRYKFDETVFSAADKTANLTLPR